MPRSSATLRIFCACADSIVKVSKKLSLISSRPICTKAWRSSAVLEYTRSAILRMPLAPWNTAYILAITAKSTCAVQILEVAFSRRICCSRVCSAKRKAVLPCASTDTPTKRPGMVRLSASLVAIKPACGPPKPNGTPKRCELPTAISAPHSPGAFKTAKANKSVATATIAPCAWACWQSVS